MKININIPATPKRIRILAAFMAFLIFALTFQEAFVGWGGIRVKAEGTYADRITATTTQSKIKSSLPAGTQTSTHTGKGVTATDGGTFSYTYTGNIKANPVSVYDYLTDGEITGTWNVLNDNYFTTSGYYNPYHKLNTAISNTTYVDPNSPFATITDSLASESIVIVFKPLSSHFSYTSNGIWVYMWDSSDKDMVHTLWPGNQMTYDSGTGQYTYKFNPKNLGFMPDAFIFSNNTDNSSSNHQRTYPIMQTVTVGHTYTFTETTSGGNITIKFGSSLKSVGKNR